MKRLLVIFVTLLSLPDLMIAANPPTPVFYVSPTGNDHWSGSRPAANWRKSDGPFASIPRALQAARDSAAKGRTSGAATIQIRGGTYFLAEPIILTPKDSGVTLAAYRNEGPVISGGRLISGWKETKISGRLMWAADVPQAKDGKWNFRELWVNGQRAVRARHPNTGYLKVTALPDSTKDWFTGHERFRFAEGELKNWPGITDAEVIVMNRWAESRLPVRSVDEKESIASFSKRSVFQLAPGDLYYLEGALEALDQPGEWSLDRARGTVYYQPRPGEKLRDILAIAPVLAQVVRGEGHPDKNEFIEGVTLRGLTFSHTEWCFPSGFDSGKGKPEVEPAPKAEVGGFAQAAIGVPGSVWGQGLRRCVFEHCSFSNSGTYGLELARGCASNRIVACEFSCLGAGGMKIGETAIRGNAAEQTGDNEISDCRIHDGGKMFHSAIGVWIGQSPNNRITHNIIHDFFYTGISIGWTWGYGPALATNNLVAFNHIHHLGKKSDGDGPILSDMGGIYTLGMQPGTRVDNNLWHDIAGLQYGGWGIYFDEGSSSIVARSNVVYGTTHGGFHQHYGATNLVCNNVFAFARDHQIQRTRPEPHLSFTFVTNIVYFDQGVVLGGNWSNDQYRMDRNIYWDARPGAKNGDTQFAGASQDQWRARGHDLHSAVADPLFVAPAEHDFRLQPNSPALKLGFLPIDLTQVGPRKTK
ncbi:MAG TPA: right-handed parallel beta-helix repeat-containing protein [Verrucomicrobiae bacterium]